MTNRQVAEQIGALAKQLGRIEKRLEEVEQRLTAPLAEVIRELKAQNERLGNVERSAATLQADMSIVKHSAVPEAIRPVSIRRSIQKPPSGG